MDQRQTQIREGAGLEESRLNVEFIELLRKWSSPVLLVAAVVAFGFFGYQKLQESRLKRLNTAFEQLEAAGGENPSPESLRGVAAEYGDVRAVGALARLTAADVYLRAVRLGLKIGAQPEPDAGGQAKYKAEDLLTEADRGVYLDEAAVLYSQVVEETKAKPGMTVLHTLGGLYGLAAVAESKGDVAQAKSFYEQVVSAAEKAGFEHHVAIARSRIVALDVPQESPKLYDAADLPKPPAPPAPPVDVNAPADATDIPEAQPVDPAPDAGEPGQGEVPGAPAEEPAPAPTDEGKAPAPDQPK
jgi:hypothetical protein